MKRYLWYAGLGMTLAFTVAPGAIMASSPQASQSSLPYAHVRPSTQVRSAAVSSTPGFTGAMQYARGNASVPTNLSGGQLTSSNVVIYNSMGAGEEFAQTANWNIYHRWQAGANGAWSAWSYFGGASTVSGGLGYPTVAMNANGTLEVFSVDQRGYIWHNWQTVAGSAWNGWKVFTSNVTTTAGNSGITVVANKDGRLELFAPLAGGVSPTGVWHIWETAVNGSWNTSWAFLSTQNLHNMKVSWDANGQMELFGLNYAGSNGSTGYMLTQYYQSGANGSWNGPVMFGSNIISFAVSKNMDGHLEMIANGWYGNAWQALHTWEAGANGPWVMWTTFGVTGGFWVVAGKNQNGMLEDYIYTTSEVWHNWQTVSGTTWNGWKLFATMGFSNLKATNDADGRQELFGIDSSGNLWQDWQTTPNGMWNGWVEVGHP